MSTNYLTTLKENRPLFNPSSYTNCSDVDCNLTLCQSLANISSGADTANTEADRLELEKIFPAGHEASGFGHEMSTAKCIVMIDVCRSCGKVDGSTENTSIPEYSLPGVYYCRLAHLAPLSCSPKANIIIGRYCIHNL